MWDSGWLSQEASSYAEVTFGWTFTNILAIYSVICLLVQLFLLTKNIHSLFIMARLKIDDVIQNHLNEKLLVQYVFAWLMGDSSFNLLSRPTTEMRMFKIFQLMLLDVAYCISDALRNLTIAL